MDQRVIRELAPNGVLRAGINLSNFLLVSGSAENGDPAGVSPDMAKAVAECLDASVQYVCYDSPGELADSCDHDEWDICNIGAEPQRAEKISFTAAYSEIEATYLVSSRLDVSTPSDIDRPGTRISVRGGSAYGLWLERNIKHAELVLADSLDSAFDRFIEEELDVLAGLRPRLLSDAEKIPGSRILEGKFSAVQQAIGTPRRNLLAASWMKKFVEDSKRSGFVAGLIEKHRVEGLSVAPLAN